MIKKNIAAITPLGDFDMCPIILILPKLLRKINYGTTPGHGYSFYTKYHYTKGFPYIMREPVPMPGALPHLKDTVMFNSQDDILA